jgi:hypothetical protein
MLARADTKVRGRLGIKLCDSLTSPRVDRISGPEKFRSSARKDFCGGFCTFRTWRNGRLESEMRSKADIAESDTLVASAAPRGPFDPPASDNVCASADRYPSLATAFLAWRRIDFSAGLHGLCDRSESSAIACGTFNLSH